MTANVEAPTLTPPRVSLLSAADIVPMADDRWESGFKTWTEGCEVAYLYPVCPDPDQDPKSEDGQGDEETYQPYVVYAVDKCSTFARDRDFYGRATRKLILAESAKLERELWLGEAGGNPALGSEADTLTTSGSTAADGIAILDQAIGDCSSGRGMIHVRPFLLKELLRHSAIRREGNIYLSPMDNIVVPGRGYPGTGPGGEPVGATEWMFGHPGIVQIRHSEIIYTPKQTEQSAQYNWTTNDRVVRAERVTHVALDPSCCVWATEVASLAVTLEND